MSDLNQIHAALQRPSLNDGQYRDCYGSAFGHRLSPGRQSKEFWTWGLLHKKTGAAAQNLASTSTPTTDSSTLEFSCTALSPESQPHSKNEIIPNPYETRMDQKRLRRARGNCINTLTPPLLTLNPLILAAINVLFPVCPMLS